MPTNLTLSPLASLQAGRWFKLICGASYQHIPTIRSLTIAYTLAGADCIDIAADPAIVATVQEAIAAAQRLDPNCQPWLMVSLNDGEDPHFRKAEFNASQCPIDCPRPCETICPAAAIGQSGVIDALCYGCGRCLPICPIGLIQARNYVYRPEVVVPMVMAAGIDAIEIHTQIGRIEDFTRLWSAIAPYTSGPKALKLIAISCGDGENLIEYLWALNAIISPASQPLNCALIWQTDGRPMSGDIGAGATRACLKLGEKVLNAGLPGFVQLAGGTNATTVAKAQAIQSNGSKLTAKLAGIAYGSYARSLLQPILGQLETPIEAHPSALWEAVAQAQQLTQQLKSDRQHIRRAND
jgi:Fe-S-cluster-containing hydrogenase component 2